jgi:hypothetical protein
VRKVAREKRRAAAGLVGGLFCVFARAVWGDGWIGGRASVVGSLVDMEGATSAGGRGGRVGSGDYWRFAAPAWRRLRPMFKPRWFVFLDATRPVREALGLRRKFWRAGKSLP